MHMKKEYIYLEKGIQNTNNYSDKVQVILVVIDIVDVAFISAEL